MPLIQDRHLRGQARPPRPPPGLQPTDKFSTKGHEDSGNGPKDAALDPSPPGSSSPRGQPEKGQRMTTQTPTGRGTRPRAREALSGRVLPKPPGSQPPFSREHARQPRPRPPQLCGAHRHGHRDHSRLAWAISKPVLTSGLPPLHPCGKTSHGPPGRDAGSLGPSHPTWTRPTNTLSPRGRQVPACS